MNRPSMATCLHAIPPSVCESCARDVARKRWIKRALALNNYYAGRAVAETRMITSAKKLGIPCEADRAWGWFVEHKGGERTQEARDLEAHLKRNKICGIDAVERRRAPRLSGARCEDLGRARRQTSRC